MEMSEKETRKTEDEDRSQAPLPGDAKFRLLVESVRDYAIFLLDPEGHITSWNRGAEQIKGYKAEEILGKPFTIFYPSEAIERGWPQRELEFAKAQGRFEDEGWRVRKDGSLFWANVVITALFDETGAHLGFAKVTRDLTDRMRLEETLRLSEERNRILIQGVRDYAIILIDPEGYISTWNEGAERIIGYSSREIIGQHHSRFYPSEDIASDKPLRVLQTAREQGRAEDEGWRVRKDGSRFWANVVVTAIHDPTGRLLGFTEITRDMTERRRVQTLEESGRLMTEFLAMLGHELRNPLAPVRNATAIIRERKHGDASIQWASDVIDRQVSHLGHLVDDLLDVSRITSGKISLHREPLDLSLVVDRAVEGIRPLIDARNHRLEVALAAEPLSVMGDLTRLSQVVLNLLDNSAKFTPEGGHIRLSAAREGGEVLLRVHDTGIGIAPELLGRIFDLFTQGERGLDRSEGGLGIGLALVRRVVEMHGGTVEARSAGPGKGSEFVLRLPFREAPSARRAAQSGRGTRATVPHRVLVVDDSRDSVESMAMLLRTWGHRVETAMEGSEALRLAATFRPEVVFLDLGLPGMSGFEVAEALGSMKDFQEVLLVAITGYGQDLDRRRTREAGFDYHLTKPVDPSVLQGLLSSIDRPTAGEAPRAES